MIADCATACAPHPGEVECGDRVMVAERDGGLLVAAIDGLGHGRDAQAAAVAAMHALEQDPESSLEEQFVRCDARLRATRGAVMGLAQLDATGRMRWLGVGNIEGLLVRGPFAPAPGRELMLALGGIVGYRMPELRTRELAVFAGDTLVLATDGIRPGFAAAVSPARSPQEIADELLARWTTGRDDACAVVARYRGAA